MKLGCCLLLVLSIFVPVAAGATDLPPNDDLRNRAWRYKPCRDKEVAKLVGQSRLDALKKVRGMGLMVVRILSPTAPVTYEVFPERLTLVIADDGLVLRAFCR